LVDKDTFPEYFEESMKGDGYFEFEVRPLVFRLITTGTAVNPSRGDYITMRDSQTNAQILYGMVDEVQDVDTDNPEITVYPQALLLKDFVVGDDLDLTDDETVKDYIFPVQHIRETVRDIVARANVEYNTTFSVSIDSIPDEVLAGEFFGNKLKKFGGSSLEKSILKLLGSTFSSYITKLGGEYYMIRKDASFEDRVVIGEADLLNFTLRRDFTIFRKTFTIDFGSLRVPSSDFTLPTVAETHHVWRLAGGGMDYIGDFDNVDAFGPKFWDKSASNVTSSVIKGFAQEKGMTEASLEITVSFDQNDGNTYALVSGQFKNDVDTKLLLLSFETSFDYEFAGEYRDSTAMEIIRDLAVVSNRWFYIDRTGLVYMLPRSQGRGSVALTAGKTLEYKKTIRREASADVSINQYEENDDGEVKTYGLKIRKNAWEALVSAYKTLFSGDVSEYTLLMYDEIDDDILKEATFDGENIGRIISIEHSILEKKARAVVENGV